MSKNNSLEEQEKLLKELERKGIISFSEWENISEYEKKCECRVCNTKLDLILTQHSSYYKIGDLMFSRLKEIKIETESEFLGTTPKENEKLYFVFVNFKDDAIAYIPLDGSEVSE